MNDTSSLVLLMMMNTIGLSVVFAEFQRAYWIYSGKADNPKFYKSASESLAFIQGTGLDIVLHYYGLMYSPHRLRNAFFSMVGDHAKIE
jgi:hypothetical protein